MFHQVKIYKIFSVVNHLLSQDILIYCLLSGVIGGQVKSGNWTELWAIKNIWRNSDSMGS